jgi:microcystin-dependent protein
MEVFKMELYLSTILEMALHWTPRGLAPCDGRKIPIQHNEALFSLLGLEHGGDGVHEFGLPDLRPLDENGQKRDWKPGEMRKFIVVEGLYPVRD